MAVAAACFRTKLAGEEAPAGERTARVLAGYRRSAGDRGRGQARPFGVSDLAAVLATCHRPRRRSRGGESDQVALERGRLDAVIAGLLFMAGMRRSEVSALRWADVADSTDGDGMLVTVRRSKTGAALLRRRLFHLYHRRFCSRTITFRFVWRGDSAPDSAHPPLSGGQPGLITAPGRFGRPLRPLDIRAAFWYGALGREMPLRWP